MGRSRSFVGMLVALAAASPCSPLTSSLAGPCTRLLAIRADLPGRRRCPGGRGTRRSADFHGPGPEARDGGRGQTCVLLRASTSSAASIAAAALMPANPAPPSRLLCRPSTRLPFCAAYDPVAAMMAAVPTPRAHLGGGAPPGFAQPAAGRSVSVPNFSVFTPRGSAAGGSANGAGGSGGARQPAGGPAATPKMAGMVNQAIAASKKKKPLV